MVNHDSPITKPNFSQSRNQKGTMWALANATHTQPTVIGGMILIGLIVLFLIGMWYAASHS